MKTFNVLVVGDGLSSLAFCYGFQQNKKIKVDVLSPSFKNDIKDKNNIIKDKLKIPYHFASHEIFRDIQNYFIANNINFDKGKLEICGILGKAMGGERRYDGPMGKSDRATVVGVICLLFYFDIGVEPYLKYIFAIAVGLVSLSSVIRLKHSIK